MPEAMFVDGRRGNAEIHIHTKFHLVWCASLRSEEVVIGQFLLMVVMETMKYICTQFHLNVHHSWEV